SPATLLSPETSSFFPSSRVSILRPLADASRRRNWPFVSLKIHAAFTPVKASFMFPEQMFTFLRDQPLSDPRPPWRSQNRHRIPTNSLTSSPPPALSRRDQAQPRQACHHGRRQRHHHVHIRERLPLSIRRDMRGQQHQPKLSRPQRGLH